MDAIARFGDNVITVVKIILSGWSNPCTPHPAGPQAGTEARALPTAVQQPAHLPVALSGEEDVMYSMLTEMLTGPAVLTLTDGQRVNTDITNVIYNDDGVVICLVAKTGMIFPWPAITSFKKRET
jgi:hypothetical protein